MARCIPNVYAHKHILNLESDTLEVDSYCIHVCLVELVSDKSLDKTCLACEAGTEHDYLVDVLILLKLISAGHHSALSVSHLLLQACIIRYCCIVLVSDGINCLVVEAQGSFELQLVGSQVRVLFGTVLNLLGGFALSL